MKSRKAGSRGADELGGLRGDAVAVRTPRGRWLLFDAGPKGTDYDAGERRVLPHLDGHGPPAYQIWLPPLALSRMRR